MLRLLTWRPPTAPSDHIENAVLDVSFPRTGHDRFRPTEPGVVKYEPRVHWERLKWNLLRPRFDDALGIVTTR